MYDTIHRVYLKVYGCTRYNTREEYTAQSYVEPRTADTVNYLTFFYNF